MRSACEVLYVCVCSALYTGMACPGNTVPSVLILHTSQIEAEQSQFEYLKLTPACAWLNQNIYFRPRKENEWCSKSTVYTMLFGSSHALVMSRNNAQLKKKKKMFFVVPRRAGMMI